MVFGGCSVTPDYSVLHGGNSANENQEFNANLSLLAGQASKQGDYRIGPEDLIEVTLFDIEDLQGEPRLLSTRVSNGGFVTLPYVGKVQAQGFTPLEFEEHLRMKFRRFIRSPQITVFIREYRSYEISIVGYVENPGVVQLRGRKTLLEALALAGGLNDEAGRTVRLTRQMGDQTLTEVIDLERLARGGDMKLNPVMLPGDVINVPRAGVFYVEGMVNKPGAYPLLQDTSVTQAIATAGGPAIALARESGIVLYRKVEDGQRVPMPVDVAAIRLGEAEDFLVQEDDLVVVPVSGPKFFVDRLLGLVRVGFNTTN